MRQRCTTIMVALALVATLSSSASASIVTLAGLVDTGLDTSLAPLVVGAADPHYLVPVAPGGVTEAFRVQPATPYWYSDSLTNGKWIGPDLSSQKLRVPEAAMASDPVGLYKYRLDFVVPVSYLPYLEITGKWATDNDAELWTLYSNGALVDTTSFAAFGALRTFTIESSLLVAGANSLEFRVMNGNGNSPTGNPSGLLVTDLTATVPEPASILVWSLLGTAGAAAAIRNRKRRGWSDENRQAVYDVIQRG